MQLVSIAWNVILPIFLLMGVGFAAQRRVGFDIKSLTRLNFWVFVPSFLFVRILESTLSGRDWLRITTHFAMLFATMFALTWYGAGLVGASDRLRRAMTASVLFYNSGNYGVPVAQLAFGGVGLAVQAIIITLQNVSNFTIGLALQAGGREGGSRRQTLQAVLALPMVHTLMAALLWRATGWSLPAPFKSGLDLVANGMVPVALVTLGAQMANLESRRFSREMALTLFLRLCLGPLLGFLLVRLLDIRGTLGQALVVSTSFPTAVNSALLALEFDNEPDYAAAVVFYSTLCSAVTVSLVIYLVKGLSF